MVLWEMVTDKLEKFLSDVGFNAEAVRGIEPDDVSSVVFIGLFLFFFFWWLVFELEIMAAVIKCLLIDVLGLVEVVFVAGDG